jgi:hypothetical protein
MALGGRVIISNTEYYRIFTVTVVVNIMHLQIFTANLSNHSILNRRGGVGLAGQTTNSYTATR